MVGRNQGKLVEDGKEWLSFVWYDQLVKKKATERYVLK